MYARALSCDLCVLRAVKAAWGSDSLKHRRMLQFPQGNRCTDGTLFTATNQQPKAQLLSFLKGAHCWDTAQSTTQREQWSPRSDLSCPALLQGGFQEVERFLTGQGLNTNLVANKVSQAGTVAGEPARAVRVLCGSPANAAAVTTALILCCMEQVGKCFPGSSQALCCTSLWQGCWSGVTSQP